MAQYAFGYCALKSYAACAVRVEAARLGSTPKAAGFVAAMVIARSEATKQSSPAAYFWIARFARNDE
jgi:hypothetical protein